MWYNKLCIEDLCAYLCSLLVPQSQSSLSLDIENYMLTQQPRLMDPVVKGDLVSKVSCTLEKSVEESGGVAAILFLIAKVN